MTGKTVPSSVIVVEAVIIVVGDAFSPGNSSPRELLRAYGWERRGNWHSEACKWRWTNKEGEMWISSK
jgi:hypothetical protein